MGLFDKVKGILFDEEEVEIPEIKKESKKNIEHIKEENPIKEIKIPKDDFSDKEYKSESTFTFPIDFDDEEPINIREEIKPVNEIKENNIIDRVEEEKTASRDYKDFLNSKSEKKRFTPTPIISPVYGVLDQNYKKEDVIVKNEVLRNNGEPTLEMVRKKAFGSLEDDLEQNLTKTKEIKITEEVKVKKEKKVTKKDKVEDPVDKLKTIGELIEEDSHSLEIPEINSINEGESEYNSGSDDKVDEVPTKTVDDILNDEENTVVDSNDAEIDDEEADLFSLIDSMYEEKGE